MMTFLYVKMRVVKFMEKIKEYDVCIIGGGIAGLMAAYTIVEQAPKAKVILLEKGRDINDRHCPIVGGQSKTCLKCRPCAIMEGLAGAGAFSDGKYIISSEYGGWLPDFMDREEVLKYIREADDILVRFGATKEVYYPDDELKLMCLRHDLHMQQAIVKHLGTDANLKTMANLITYLKDKIEISTLSEAIDVDITNHQVLYHLSNQERYLKAANILIAVGRSGSRYFQNWCNKNHIPLANNQVDVGVRVELPYNIWEHFSKRIYEPKIVYRTKAYHDQVRMFCFNERGYVVTENTDGVLTVNGHSFKASDKRSENSNFALLSTSNFTSPFNEPIEYARSIASLANQISGGSVLVQRLGDLINGKRTNERRLKESSVRPTLNAVAGDLSLCMPKRQLDNIIETLYALDKVAPGTANYDTLLYGVECKYYSARPKCHHFMIDGCNKIYALGDGAGFTRSLSQAAANGIIVAKEVIKDL